MSPETREELERQLQSFECLAEQYEQAKERAGQRGLRNHWSNLAYSTRLRIADIRRRLETELTAGTQS